jgi:hypothetical protein
MAKQSYAIEPDGAKRITVSWKAFWKDFTVEFDDVVIGVLSGQKELKEGRSFQLSDGSVLDVKLTHNFTTQLQLLRNGKPLPGSGTDPSSRLRQSYGTVYFIGGFNIFLGLISLLIQSEFLYEMGIGYFSLILGLIYLVLAFFVQRQSIFALILSLLIYGIDTILILFAGLSTGVIIRIVFLILIWQGFKAIKELKAKETELP